MIISYNSSVKIYNKFCPRKNLIITTTKNTDNSTFILQITICFFLTKSILAERNSKQDEKTKISQHP